MRIRLSDDHMSFQTASSLREATKEFCKVMHTDIFYYAHVKQSQHSILTTRPECNRAIFEAGLVPQFSQLREGIYYLPNTDSQQQRVEFNRWFKIFHQLEFIRPCSDGFKIFGVASSHDQPEMINHYFNHLRQFNEFFDHFELTAHDLVKKSQLALIPNSNQLGEREQSSPFPAQFFVDVNNNRNVILSQRELELLYYLCKGQTIREAADSMQLSNRTAESYLVNIKNKLGLNRKSDVIAFCFAQESICNQLLRMKPATFKGMIM